MNYITEIKAFHDLIQIKQLSTGQIALWYALMYINNKCNWIEWFTVPNQTLELNTGLSRQGIIKARNILKQNGVIAFRSNGTKATSYKMITLSKSLQAGIQDGVQDSLQAGIQDGVQIGSALNKLNETKLNETRDISVREEEKRKWIDYQRVADMYNETCVSFPRCTKISESRKKAIKARLNSGYTYDDFKNLFEKAENSRFLKGGNDRNWKADFDWLLKDSNIAKVLDGRYDDSGSAPPKPSKFNNFSEQEEYDFGRLEKAAMAKLIKETKEL